jgi:rhodanese-related sulfurtransferase
MNDRFQKLTFDEAHDLMERDPACLLLDVREEEEYITGHAIGAVLFPLDDIDQRSAQEVIPAPSTPVLLYCRSGRRSQLAAEKLSDLGYTRVYDLGSLIGWPYGME